MSDYGDLDIPDVDVKTGDIDISVPPAWEDECFEYSETVLYRNRGGSLTITTRFENVDEYGYPPEFDIIVGAIEVFDGE